MFPKLEESNLNIKKSNSRFIERIFYTITQLLVIGYEQTSYCIHNKMPNILLTKLLERKN